MFGLLLLLSAGAVSVEGRGAALETRELRARARVLVVGSVQGEAGVAFGSEALTARLGVGFAADLGVLIDDRLGLSMRLESSVVPGGLSEYLPSAYLTFGGGPSLDFFVSHRVTLGLGARLGTFTAGLGQLTLGVPLRLNLFLGAREATAIARTGLVLGFQLVPAYSFSSVFGPSLGVSITVGYGLW